MFISNVRIGGKKWSVTVTGSFRVLGARCLGRSELFSFWKQWSLAPHVLTKKHPESSSSAVGRSTPSVREVKRVSGDRFAENVWYNNANMEQNQKNVSSTRAQTRNSLLFLINCWAVVCIHNQSYVINVSLGAWCIRQSMIQTYADTN